MTPSKSSKGITYHKPLGGNMFVKYAAHLKEVSMSKKTEVKVEVEKTDDNGIITKQSEVYVWNDQVFASYKAALAASKKDRIVDLLVEKQYPHSAGYTAAQRKQYASQWKANPLSYSVNTKYALDTIIELLAD
jgi:hypothetical protein